MKNVIKSICRIRSIRREALRGGDVSNQRIGTTAGCIGQKGAGAVAWLARAARVVAIWPLFLALAGCQTAPAPQFAAPDKPDAAKPNVIVLHEGDSVRISFPGAPNLNTVAQIRRDGRITLPLIGEFQAAGLTPGEMEKELIKLYGPQLQTKEVTVAVESSAFPVYVTGAVLRPGKIMSDRPITVLEAIMEAGGFDYTKANLKAVRVIRHENGRTEHHTLNLKRVLQGNETEQFNLKPSDIIYVPERFSWF
jgi:polysaccharide export outer membrane protein